MSWQSRLGETQHFLQRVSVLCTAWQMGTNAWWLSPLLFTLPPPQSLLLVGFITRCQYKPTIKSALDDTVGYTFQQFQVLFRCYLLIHRPYPRLIAPSSCLHRPVCQGSLHSVTQLLIKRRSWCSCDKEEGKTKDKLQGNAKTFNWTLIP